MPTPARFDEISAAGWQMAVGQPGQVVTDDADIAQCMRTILRTPKGSVPLRPEFGSDLWLWIDAPVNVAAPSMVREATEALVLWEPRAKVEAIEPAYTAAGVELVVTWHPVFGGDSRAERVTL